MSDKTNTPKHKRRWFRFKLRTLIVIVTLICLYLGSWELTKDSGMDAVVQHAHTNDGVMPVNGHSPVLFVCSIDWVAPDPNSVPVQGNNPGILHSTLYLWFFGLIVRLSDKPAEAY